MMLHVERINAVSVTIIKHSLQQFVNTIFCLLCRQLDADKKLLSLYLKEFSKLLLSNTTSHLHVHFVTLVFYLKAFLMPLNYFFFYL